jgi:hypothetical protein
LAGAAEIRKDDRHEQKRFKAFAQDDDERLQHGTYESSSRAADD